MRKADIVRRLWGICLDYTGSETYNDTVFVEGKTWLGGKKDQKDAGPRGLCGRGGHNGRTQTGTGKDFQFQIFEWFS
jgi:hypothetical protein